MPPSTGRCRAQRRRRARGHRAPRGAGRPLLAPGAATGRARASPPPLRGPGRPPCSGCSRSASPSRSSPSRSPAIADDLGSSKTTLTWVITGPMLAFGIVGPAARARPATSGATSASTSSALGAAGAVRHRHRRWRGTRASLIAFRVPRRRRRARPPGRRRWRSSTRCSRPRSGCRPWAAGRWSGRRARCSASSPAGPSSRRFGWRWIFVVQVPADAARRRRRRRCSCPRPTGVDARPASTCPGAVLLAVGVTSLLLGAQPGPGARVDAARSCVGGFVLVPASCCGPSSRRERAHRLAAGPHRLLPPAQRRRADRHPVLHQLRLHGRASSSRRSSSSEVFGYGETRIGLLSIARPLRASPSAAPALRGYVARRVGERQRGHGRRRRRCVAVDGDPGVARRRARATCSWSLALGLSGRRAGHLGPGHDATRRQRRRRRRTSASPAPPSS